MWADLGRIHFLATYLGFIRTSPLRLTRSNGYGGETCLVFQHR
jgi:hypothetical protein